MINYYFRILLVSIIDFLIFWIWFWHEDPEPSVAIALVLIIPFTIILNLIIAGVFRLLKKINWSKVFLLNSILASIIAYYLWGNAIQRHQDRIWETWSFNYDGKHYEIDLYKPDKTFDLIYRPENRPSTDLILSGKVDYNHSKIHLVNDSIRLVIENDSLHGFMNENIKLKSR